MKRIIITSADETYSNLLLDLLASLHQWDEKPFDDIGVLDVGLSASTLNRIKDYTESIVKPDWDLPVNEDLREEKPYLRAFTARPYLRKYFPGYDAYLWIDSDAWVQERYAVDWLFQAVEQGTMGIVTEYDRCYFELPDIVTWKVDRLSNAFGKEAQLLFLVNHYYNAGVFSLGSDMPHWNRWVDYFRTSCSNSSVISDQTALNYLLWKEKLPIHPLPALCNWCCHLAVPFINIHTQKLCEPFIPQRPIGIIHLAGKSKQFEVVYRIEERSITTNLHYSGLRRIMEFSARR